MTTTTYILVLLALCFIYGVGALIIVKVIKREIKSTFGAAQIKDDGQIVKASTVTFNLKEVDGHEE